MNGLIPREECLSYFRSHQFQGLSFSMRIDSGVEGPHVVVVGGTHGNEPSGVKAVVEVHDSIVDRRIVLNRGKITFILGNPTAFERDERYVDEDLNRAFTDQQNNTIEGRRATEIRRFSDRAERMHAVLDLHSVSIGDLQIASYNIENRSHLDFVLRISVLNTHLAYHPRHIQGLLIEEFTRCGAEHVAAIECGNHEASNAAEVALEHIHNLLARCGLIDERYLADALSAHRETAITQYETLLPIVPGKNFRFLVPDVRTGLQLSKGDVYAVDDNGDHIAPSDCYLVLPSKEVRETDRDVGFLCRLNRIGET
jgi:predicted deacylase